MTEKKSNVRRAHEFSTTDARTGIRSRTLKKGTLNFSMAVCFRLHARS